MRECAAIATSPNNPQTGVTHIVRNVRRPWSHTITQGHGGSAGSGVESSGLQRPLAKGRTNGGKRGRACNRGTGTGIQGEGAGMGGTSTLQARCCRAHQRCEGVTKGETLPVVRPVAQEKPPSPQTSCQPGEIKVPISK